MTLRYHNERIEKYERASARRYEATAKEAQGHSRRDDDGSIGVREAICCEEYMTGFRRGNGSWRRC